MNQQVNHGSIASLSEEEFYDQVHQIIKSDNSNYKPIIQRILQDYETNVEQAKQKVQEVYQRYAILEGLYKKERLKVEELSDNIYLNQEQPQPQQQQQQQQEGEDIETLKKEMEKQKLESRELATKQGQRRKELEDQLMAKDIELKKLKTEAFENNRLREEVASLRTLVHYYKQNSQTR